MNRSIAWPLVVAASTGAALAGLAMGLDPPVAPLLALWYLGVCPGIGWVRLLRMHDPLAEILLAVALSLSVGAVVSVLLLALGVWSSGLALVLTGVVALAGAGADLMAQARETGDPADPPPFELTIEASEADEGWW